MSARRVEAFLLRLVVHENQPLTPGSWRGRIQHVATGEEQHIDELRDALSFIATRLGAGLEFSPIYSESEGSSPLPRSDS